jgi:hypothetical protein
VEKVLPIENFISYPTYLLFDRHGKLNGGPRGILGSRDERLESLLGSRCTSPWMTAIWKALP